MSPSSTRRRDLARRRSAAATWRGDQGMVTAEIAMALPAIGAMIVLAIWAVSAVVADLRCDDAAREAARAVARGEPTAVVEEIVERIGPDGASLVMRRDDGLVVVEVRSTVPIPGPFRSPAVRVSGDAVALEEVP